MAAGGEFERPEDLHAWLSQLVEGSPGGTVYNVSGTVRCMKRATLAVETELFPRAALEFYTRFNLGEVDQGGAGAAVPAEQAQWYSAARGGAQGDYREGMAAKLANVVDCLRRFPQSKRALLTIPFSRAGSALADHSVDAEAKCLRELQFYVKADGRVHCSGVMRAQAASIFPKNIHFIGEVLNRVAERLGREPGSYHHFVTIFVADRS